MYVSFQENAVGPGALTEHDAYAINSGLFAISGAARISSSLANASRMVVFPAPVGPVTMTNPVLVLRSRISCSSLRHRVK